VFHDVHHASARIIYERDLLGKLLARVGVPGIGALGDLRDPELKRLGLDRREVVATPAEHYPCTRRLAVEGLGRTLNHSVLQGFIWHSRQAELAGEAPAEVIVLFGHPRYPSGRGTWSLEPPGLTALYEGPGRLLVDQIAERLSAVVEPVDG